MKEQNFSDRELRAAAGKVRRSMLEAMPEQTRHDFPEDFDLKIRRIGAREKRRRAIFSALRHAAVACLAVALILTTWVAMDVEAGDNSIRWTVRVKEDCVVYRFRSGTDPQEPIPAYEPTWLPEGYELEMDTWDLGSDDTESRILSYGKSADERASIWFDYSYVGKGYEFQFSDLDEGTYVKKTVDINGIPGDLYLYLKEYEGGGLIWIDKETSIMFYISVIGDDADIAERVAESVAIVEPAA